MMSLYTIALILFTVAPFACLGVCYFNSMGNKLLPQSKGGKSKSCIERGEGICSGERSFGLTESGQLRLYKGDKWEWESVKKDIELCNMSEGGGGGSLLQGQMLQPQGQGYLCPKLWWKIWILHEDRWGAEQSGEEEKGYTFLGTREKRQGGWKLRWLRIHTSCSIFTLYGFLCDTFY